MFNLILNRTKINSIVNVQTTDLDVSHRSLNSVVAHLKNFPFWVNITIELKTVTTANNNNNKQVNAIKVNTLRAIPKYYDGINFFAPFSYASFFDICHYWIQWAIYSK